MLDTYIVELEAIWPAALAHIEVLGLTSLDWAGLALSACPNWDCRVLSAMSWTSFRLLILGLRDGPVMGARTSSLRIAEWSCDTLSRHALTLASASSEVTSKHWR